MEESMVTLLKENNPFYYKYFIFIFSFGNKCMYEESKKAIYSTL